MLPRCLLSAFGCRGYGWNKVQHIAALNATGFRFVVHPTGFIIHRAHERTRTK
jgi:hypothetical protein